EAVATAHQGGPAPPPPAAAAAGGGPSARHFGLRPSAGGLRWRHRRHRSADDKTRTVPPPAPGRTGAPLASCPAAHERSSPHSPYNADRAAAPAPVAHARHAESP